ncbi:MAG TPA: cell division protein FtsL [Gammaproteobacteria bacterium]|nr:cell division protein FtsL [Gammaproteobacteria bacterium]
MSRRTLIWLTLAILAVLASGVGVVYAKAQSRALFVELQKQRARHELASMEWGRLQLELASTGSLEDVMRAAGGRLRMHAPSPEDVVVVD